jgi:cytochrome c peroxidase
VLHVKILSATLIPALVCGICHAGGLVVQIEPRWQGKPLQLAELSMKNSAGNVLSITRLAGLLSGVKLQREDGTWIGTGDRCALFDVEKKQMTFTLENVPAAKYRALRFDLGLDPDSDRSDPAKRPPGHPLHPDVSGLHRGRKDGYVFLALEGRWNQASDFCGGYSYQLAGEACRRTVEVPAEMDLRENLRVTLAIDAARIFSEPHRIDIAAADFTCSGNDDGLAVRLAENAVAAFSLLRVESHDGEVHARPAARGNFPADVSLEIPAEFPQAAWPADNVLTKDGIALGRRLFNDGRLSATNQKSCASCHWEQLAFSDPPRFSTGTDGQQGARNSLPLMNLAWKPSFFWDGRVASLREQVRHPITDPLEMNETLENVVAKLQRDRFYPASFAKAFGSPGITAERLGLALEQYLLTLVNGHAKLDRVLRGKDFLTEDEQLGFDLFFAVSDPGRGIRGAGCFHCHGGAQFTNHAFRNNGLDADGAIADAGREKVTGNPADRGKFMVPSLRNLTLTDPYMHDGRFDTLEAVIEHYDHGVVRSATLDPNLAMQLTRGGLGLKPDEKRALVAFLETLTDEPAE